MKTITIHLYEFDELGPKTQQRIRESFPNRSREYLKSRWFLKDGNSDDKDGHPILSICMMKDPRDDS